MSRQFSFDIPAQPLATALQQYAAVTGKPALFVSALAAGRTSSALQGRYTVEDALFKLLQGTGLTAEKLENELGRTFLLKYADPATAAADTGADAAFRRDGYAGLAQQRITQALCADARTAPGRYSAVLRFSLDATGAVHDGRLLGSTGDKRRDAILPKLLNGVRIDPPPSAALLQQPLTMVVLPAEPGVDPAQACLRVKRAEAERP